MKCATAKKMISDYIDGNLEAKQNTILKQHLDSCPDCQRLLEDLQKIASRAEKLEKLSPPADTWFKIEAKLKERKQTAKVFTPQKRQWFNFIFYPATLRYGLVSALLLALVITMAVLVPHYLKKEDTIINQQKYALAKLEEAEYHYQLAIKALREAISSQERSLDPQVASVFEENLRIINASINACKQAVLQEPDNFEARNYLLSAYQEKVNFLNEIIGLEKTYSPGNLIN